MYVALSKKALCDFIVAVVKNSTIVIKDMDAMDKLHERMGSWLGLAAEWTLHRKPLILMDRNQKKACEARLDGVLQKIDSKELLASLEVKAFLRSSKPGKHIRMQESAQMAAWINVEPPKTIETERQDARNNEKRRTRSATSTPKKM